MKPTIVFKLNRFPEVSETFIGSNIIFAIRQGFEIKVICDKFLGLANSSQQENLLHYKVGEKVIQRDNLEDKRIEKLFQLLGFLINPRNLYFTIKYRAFKLNDFLKCAFSLKQYEQTTKNHLYHVHFNSALKPLMDIVEIGYLSPVVIVTFHGFDAFLESPESFQEKYGDFYKKYVRAVTVNSNYLKQIIIGLGVDEQLIKVIPIGIDKTFFNGIPKKLKTDETVEIVTVGRLVQLKGQCYGLRTIKRLTEKDYRVHYTIVGEGPERETLENETISLGIQNHVTFAGSLSQIQIKKLLAKSHIFLMTSTFDDVSRRREAFGLVSIEAQAMGLPVIGFNSGGGPETIIEGKTGFTVFDRNENDLSERLCQLLDNKLLYQEMSKAAIDHSAVFDHKLTTQKYLDLYEDIFNKNIKGNK